MEFAKQISCQRKSEKIVILSSLPLDLSDMYGIIKYVQDTPPHGRETMSTCELVTEPSDGVEITWELEYSHSPIRPATWDNPPEGGIEIEADPRPIAITYYPNEGEEVAFDGIQEGSILDHLLVGKYDTPSDDDCFDAANGDHFDRCEDTRW